MKKIHIKGEREIGNFIQAINDDFVLISITSPEEDWASIPENVNCRGVLRLKFHDIEHPAHGYVHFSDDHAAKIKDFVEEYNYVKVIICQCEAGISRSAGVASALLKQYGMDENEIFTKGFYMPNLLVYKKMLKAFDIPVDDAELKRLGSSSTYFFRV
ncbi:MAG: hypothetical protein JSV25_11930 [Spirochaetota bacterium]|nr:MAG: hypothetical protein JSV25_11930 [Spirochaetota bacterium]